MSDLMYLGKIAVTKEELKTVESIRDGKDYYPKDLHGRGEYYKYLYDEVVNKKGISQEFKKSFSLFVSKFCDTCVLLPKEGENYG